MTSIDEHAAATANMNAAAAATASDDDAKDELPPALAAWYRAQGLEVTRIADLAPRYRYARVKDASDTDALCKTLDAEPVAWLPGFLRMPAARRLKGSAPYEDRRVFAMDAASGFAARALGCNEGDRVLDLCCAPGAKLLCLAEAVGVNGAVDGVDVSEKRLSVARKLLDAHHDPASAARVRLYRSDGRRFPDERELLYDSRAADSFEQRGARKRLNKSARQREAKRLKALPEEDCAEAYDRVLVDADCTTDGSHAHVQKMVEKGTAVDNVSAERCSSLLELQAALLRNGFGRLRRGGVLVYGTCSLTKAQNEDVVEAFLREEPAARLMSLEAPPVAVAGSIPGTVRFPAGGETSGLFVARLEKILPNVCITSTSA